MKQCIYNFIRNNSNKRSLYVPVLIFFLPACHYSEIADTKKSPNIILIVSDDQGYNDCGVFGSNEIITPNLDKLAQEGVRFTHFYVTCPFCTPSRGSLLTGRYPQRNGTYELFRNDRINDGHIYTSYEYSISPERILGMDEREVLISELLKNAGYTNGIFGKWDFGQLNRFLPLQRGFEQFYGFVNTGIDYYTHERYYMPSMYKNNEPTTEDKGIYATNLFEREALKFINENKMNSFFLYLPFNAPHVSSSLEPEIRGTVQAPPEYLELYPEGTSVKEQKRRGYLAAVTCMDNAIGNVLRLVDSLHLAEKTLVIFLSDNGGGTGSDNSPFSGGKATMWEGGIRVPCIIKWPGVIKQGQVNDNFLSSLEIFPTILAAAGIKQPDSLKLDGFDILPLLKQEKNLEREEMYWEQREEYAARVGTMKWIHSKNRKNNNGFFNLTNDPGEKNDLTNIEIEELNRVKNKFHTWQKEMIEAEPRRPFKNF